MELLYQYLSGGISVIISSIFFIAGLIQYLFPPKNINHIYGYRTKRSKKNQANWDYAQRINTLILMKISALFIVISFIVNYVILILIPNFDNVFLPPIILLILTIIVFFLWTEMKLKKFEKNNTENSISI